MMLVPTLLQEMPKPSTAMAASDNGSWVLQAKASMARPQAQEESRISRDRALPPPWLARTMVDSSEPSPAAPQSQPRVVASPPKMSLANTGSSTT